MNSLIKQGANQPLFIKELEALVEKHGLTLMRPLVVNLHRSTSESYYSGDGTTSITEEHTPIEVEMRLLVKDTTVFSRN